MTHDHDHAVEQHDLGLAYDLHHIALRTRSALTRRNMLKFFGGASVLALAACGSKAATSASASSTASPTTASGAVAPTAPATTTATTVTAGGPPPGGGVGVPGGPPPSGGVGVPGGPPLGGGVGAPGGPPPGGGVGGGGGGAGSQPTDGTIPQETAGPYPGDGSNGPNALNQSGIVRRDITSSLGSSTKAPGIPLTVKLKITKGANGPALPGASVYLWHCDQQGRYSMYSNGVTNETWLRGVQTADANGEVTFTTIYPGCYPGRWPHIHFEVYGSEAAATAGTPKLTTSQLAMTPESGAAVFGTKGYEASVANFAKITLASDFVFSDGADKETPTITGSTVAGYIATLTVPVAA